MVMVNKESGIKERYSKWNRHVHRQQQNKNFLFIPGIPLLKHSSSGRHGYNIIQ
jgi:propanediol utilization protein